MNDFTTQQDDAPDGSGTSKRPRTLLRTAAIVAAMIGLGLVVYLLVTRPVPDLKGSTLKVAQWTAKSHHLRLVESGYANVYAPPQTAGTVASQNPAPGARLWPGSEIKVVMAGFEPLAVPDLTGMDPTEALRALEALGLSLGSRSVSDVSDEPANQIVVSDPPAGSPVQPGSKIDIVVALGPDVTLPAFAGMTVSDATSLAKKLGVTLKVNGREPFAKVTRQSPSSGERVRPRTTVDVWPAEVVPKPTDPDDLYFLRTSNGSMIYLPYNPRRLTSGKTMIDYLGARFILSSVPDGLRQDDIVKVRVDGDVYFSDDGAAGTDVTIIDVWHR